MIRLIEKNEEIPFDLLLLADETIEAINKYIHNSEIYIYEKEEETIAVCALYKIDEASVEIKNIAVIEAYRGHSIGTSMIKDAIKRSKTNGFKSIFIGTGDASIKQLQLYQKIGFEMFQIKERFFLDNYPNPIYENGVQLKHMVLLKLDL